MAEQHIVMSPDHAYDALNSVLRGNVLHWKGFKIFRFVKENNNYTVGIEPFTHEDMRQYFPDKDLRTNVHKHIREHRAFYLEPRITNHSYIYNDKGELRENLHGDLLNAYSPTHNFNLVKGQINLFSSLPQIRGENNKAFEKLLYFLSNSEKDTLQTLKNFMAQYIFANRRKGRPTMVLMGSRGTGKNMLVENILREIYPTECKKMPKDYDKYQGFTDNKLVYLDETRNFDNLNVFDLCKELSGSEYVSNNQKYMVEKEVVSKTYIVLMSNGKPIHIPYRERPQTEKNNQWFVINYTNPLDENDNWGEFINEYGVHGDIIPFIKENLGSYIMQVLHPLYLETQHKKSPYEVGRYGFPIPINDALKALIDMSRTEGDSDSEVLSDFLVFEDPDSAKQRFSPLPEREKINILYNEFKDSGFLSNKLISAVLRVLNLKSTPQKIKRALQRDEILIQSNVRKRVANTQERGCTINVKAVKEIAEDVDTYEENSFDGEVYDF